MLGGWLIFGLLLLTAWPWARWLTRLTSGEQFISIVLTVALGSGLLSLVMFWLGLLGIRFEGGLISLVYLLLMLPGWLLWWRARRESKLKPADTLNANRIPTIGRWRWLAGVGMGIICLGVLFNAAYWPFSKADTLGIYHRYGVLMYETGALVPFAGRDDAFYQAYPMHLPLIYAFSYLASGGVNEYLARVTPALLSLGSIAAAWLVSRELFGGGAGWLSAFLLATTPAYIRWASSGYVDLPMAFYYTLAAYFALRLLRGQRRIDALLAGLMLGLAAWTKNAALLGIGLMALWALVAVWRRWLRWDRVLIAGLACAGIATPWYTRNWVEAGLIVPPTAWVDQAQPNLTMLLAFITHPQDFGLTGWLILIGLVLLLLTFNRQRGKPGLGLLLWLTLPFFGVWWLLVSYDLRFLLLLLPLFCALAGGILWEAWAGLKANHRRLLQPVCAVLALGLIALAAWLSVEFKDEILRHPLMSDAEKRLIVLSPD
jgi:hypothetical protein